MSDSQEQYSEQEAAQRRDEALRNALSMPPMPLKKPAKKDKKKAR